MRWNESAETDDDYEPDFDVDAWVRGVVDEVIEKIEETLGPDPLIWLEAQLPQIGHVMRGMHYLYGDEGVAVAEKRLREAIDVARRNAVMNNGGPDDDLFE